jgi:hypothetical protein
MNNLAFSAPAPLSSTTPNNTPSVDPGISILPVTQAQITEYTIPKG